MSKKTAITKVNAIIIIIIVLAAGLGAYWYQSTLSRPSMPLQPITATATAAAKISLAGVFPGTITDADYNTLGYIAMSEAAKKFGIKTAYSERVAVPDCERVTREYLSSGYNVIWEHGGQFFSVAQQLAPQFPDVVFIGEFDGPISNPPPNLWWIDRNFHTGFYVIGAIAANVTKTGKIGDLGGQTQGFSYAELNAVKQAVSKYNPSVQVLSTWVGDFNDPVKGRQLSDAMISQGVDVIMGSLNLGMYGVFESVQAAAPNVVLVTAKYTDKSDFAPKNYVTSELYDFATPVSDIITSVMQGKKGGYYLVGFGTGINIQLPLKNVPSGISDQAARLVALVKSGAVKVILDTSKPP